MENIKKKKLILIKPSVTILYLIYSPISKMTRKYCFQHLMKDSKTTLNETTYQGNSNLTDYMLFELDFI